MKSCKNRYRFFLFGPRLNEEAAFSPPPLKSNDHRPLPKKAMLIRPRLSFLKGRRYESRGRKSKHRRVVKSLAETDGREKTRPSLNKHHCFYARLARVFLHLPNYLLAVLFTLNSSTATFIRKPSNTGPAAKAAPLFSSTASPCRIITGPDSKAAMNRPQRFRGLATDPGVQRKTSKAVIQRENKPKGPRLEGQFESICTAPVAPKDQRKVSLMHLVTGALGKQPETVMGNNDLKDAEQTLQRLATALNKAVRDYANHGMAVEMDIVSSSIIGCVSVPSVLLNCSIAIRNLD